MKLRFIKCSPTENMTILVMDPVSDSLKSYAANCLMQQSHLYAEQVGFVTFSDLPDQTGSSRKIFLCKPHLEMMGGELCINAVRSLAAALEFRQNRTAPPDNDKKTSTCLIFTSGVNQPVKCTVTGTEKENTFISAAEVPLPSGIEPADIRDNSGNLIKGVLVTFPGITHLVVDRSLFKDKDLEDFFYTAAKQLEHRKHQALGIMFYDYEKSDLVPLVWVRETDTLIRERGCGSGTAAVGAAIAASQESSFSGLIRQPGGVMEITALWDSGITGLFLSGEVVIAAEGTAYL